VEHLPSKCKALSSNPSSSKYSAKCTLSSSFSGIKVMLSELFRKTRDSQPLQLKKALYITPPLVGDKIRDGWSSYEKSRPSSSQLGSTLLLEPLSQPYVVLGIFKIGFLKLFP
jgi:hypothetical protein